MYLIARLTFEIVFFFYRPYVQNDMNVALWSTEKLMKWDFDVGSICYGEKKNKIEKFDFKMP